MNRVRVSTISSLQRTGPSVGADSHGVCTDIDYQYCIRIDCRYYIGLLTFRVCVHKFRPFNFIPIFYFRLYSQSDAIMHKTCGRARNINSNGKIHIQIHTRAHTHTYTYTHTHTCRSGQIYLSTFCVIKYELSIMQRLIIIKQLHPRR